MVNKQAFVYMLASKRYGTIYTGVTNNLDRRIYEHKNKAIKGFTSEYNVVYLVWFEQYENVVSAIQREKQLKSWNRLWKIELLEKTNPEWKEIVLEN